MVQQRFCVVHIIKSKCLTERHLYWPELDIDLAVESIEQPERFPLVAKANPIVFGVGFANLPDGVDIRALERSLIVEGE